MPKLKLKIPTYKNVFNVYFWMGFFSTSSYKPYTYLTHNHASKLWNYKTTMLIVRYIFSALIYNLLMQF